MRLSNSMESYKIMSRSIAHGPLRDHLARPKMVSTSLRRVWSPGGRNVVSACMEYVTLPNHQVAKFTLTMIAQLKNLFWPSTYIGSLSYKLMSVIRMSSLGRSSACNIDRPNSTLSQSQQHVSMPSRLSTSLSAWGLGNDLWDYGRNIQSAWTWTRLAPGMAWMTQPERHGTTYLHL